LRFQTLALSTIFQPQIAKINKVPAVSVTIICSDQKLIWLDSYNGANCSLASDESILNKIIIIWKKFEIFQT